MEYATYLYNRLPKDKNHHSPIEIFSGSKLETTWTKKSRVFSCPAYVLNPVVQDGKKLPRWRPKSRRGQFLGRSPKHASNIGLIQNINTGFVSAQFCVVYGDFYTTILNSNEDKAPETWSILFDTSRELLVNKSDQPPPLHDSWLDTTTLEQ